VINIDKETIDKELNDFKNWYFANDKTIIYRKDIFLRIELIKNSKTDNLYIEKGNYQKSFNKLNIKDVNDFKINIKYKDCLVEEFKSICVDCIINDVKNTIIIPDLKITQLNKRCMLSNKTLTLTFIVNKCFYKDKPSVTSELEPFFEKQKKDISDKIDLILTSTKRD